MEQVIRRIDLTRVQDEEARRLLRRMASDQWPGGLRVWPLYYTDGEIGYKGGVRPSSGAAS
jgi:hypothetical protein